MFVRQEKTLDFLICFVTETPKSIRFLAKPTMPWTSPVLGRKKMGREKQGRSMNSGSKTSQKQIKPSVLLLGNVYIAASQMLAQQNIISNIRTVSKRMHIPMIKSNASPSGFGSRHSSTYQQHSLSVADGVCGKQTGQSSYAGNFQAPMVCFARICVHLQTMKTSSPKALMLSPATSWQPSLTGVGGNARQAAKSHGRLKKQ